MSHPQTVYPSYLTPSLTLAPTNLSISGLGLAHHNNAQNLRISPQGMSAMSQQMSAPPNMRLTPPQQHQNGLVSSTPPHQSLSQSHNPPINTQRSSPTNNTMQLASSCGSTNSLSPQNLSVSPSSQGLQITPPMHGRMGVSSLSPTSPEHQAASQKMILPTDQTELMHNGSGMVKESALNMTMNNSDMRSNSIATLRIKAKEHLESINKNLTMV